MATVREQLDSKISAGPRPTALRIDKSLGQMPDLEAIEKAKEREELDEKIAELRARGIRATVVIEAD